jgi:hypothetical protein
MLNSFNCFNTFFAQLVLLADLCRRYPLLQRVVTLLAALLLALLVLGSMLILPGLVQPVRMASALH